MEGYTTQGDPVVGLLRELEIRYRSRKRKPVQTAMVSAANVVALARAHKMHEEISETFVVLLLDSRNRVIAWHEVSRGNLKACPVSPRDVFLAAIAARADGLIFLHNHPSGDPTPSDLDFVLTQRLVDAAKLLGFCVLDHIVIGRDGAASILSPGSV